jgi:aspartyl-tRNA(Asn)/glutamyl-tRNA(Gln) amidotransferase subunit C
VKRVARISKEDVKHVANLARLTLSEDEAERFTKDLGNIIQFAEQLNELDTENVKETTHVLDMKNVLREDEARDWLTREEALKNAPDQENGQVKVPKVFEG